MPSINKINELDGKIQWNLNRLDSSMHKIIKTLETIKFLDVESSRIDKRGSYAHFRSYLFLNQNQKGRNSGKVGT